MITHLLRRKGSPTGVAVCGFFPIGGPVGTGRTKLKRKDVTCKNCRCLTMRAPRGFADIYRTKWRS